MRVLSLEESSGVTGAFSFAFFGQPTLLVGLGRPQSALATLDPTSSLSGSALMQLRDNYGFAWA